MEIGLVSLASQGHTRCTHRTYIYTHGHIYTLHKQRDAFIAFHVKPQGLKTSAIVFCGRCPSYTPFPICLLTLVLLQPCPTCSMVQTKSSSVCGLGMNSRFSILFPLVLQLGRPCRRCCYGVGAVSGSFTQLPAQFPQLWAASILEEGTVQNSRQTELEPGESFSTQPCLIFYFTA